MSSRKNFEDIDNYSASDSEDNYSDREKELLEKFRDKPEKYSDSEDEVLAVRSGESSDSDDSQSDLALSDIEGQDEEEGLPNLRAWGKDKKQYYRTDYVDQDYGGFQGKDAHLAELEEEEAKNLQKQLAEQLDDEDFALEFPSGKPVEDVNKSVEEIVKTDISKLSRRQKLQILEKESPEFFSLISDFKAKLAIARDYLQPMLHKQKSGEISKSQATNFIQTQYSLILNYCTNIYMYLYLKATKANIQNHPVIKRLYQYRQLLLKLEPVFEEIIKPQIEILLSESKLQEEKKKTARLLSSLTKKRVNPKKKVKLDVPVSEDGSIDTEGEKKTEASKRGITYEMAKNKGLTPYRKKELRNPRVKHKLKYRKAIIRRKGAVRQPRKELSRYSGEVSGIKATVSKSIKIKT